MVGSERLTETLSEVEDAEVQLSRAGRNPTSPLAPDLLK